MRPPIRLTMTRFTLNGSPETSACCADTPRQTGPTARIAAPDPYRSDGSEAFCVARHAKGFRSIGSIRVRSGNSCSRPRLSRRVGATRRRFGRTVEGEPRHGEANGGSHRVKTPGEVADE